jgi:hypothetical protein
MAVRSLSSAHSHRPPGINGTSNDPPPIEELIAVDWGYATIRPTSIQADNGAGLTRGIIGLVNKVGRGTRMTGVRCAPGRGERAAASITSKPIRPSTRSMWESKGFRATAKAALVNEAYDRRFSMGLIGSSGKGGATPLRRNWGEAVESLTGGEYYWFAGNFMKYGASEATFGPKNAGDLPADSPELIAMCAPRLVFISYGIPERGDAKWLDHQRSYMATVAAQPSSNRWATGRSASPAITTQCKCLPSTRGCSMDSLRDGSRRRPYRRAQRETFYRLGGQVHGPQGAATVGSF